MLITQTPSDGGWSRGKKDRTSSVASSGVLKEQEVSQNVRSASRGRKGKKPMSSYEILQAEIEQKQCEQRKQVQRNQRQCEVMKEQQQKTKNSESFVTPVKATRPVNFPFPPAKVGVGKENKPVPMKQQVNGATKSNSNNNTSSNNNNFLDPNIVEPTTPEPHNTLGFTISNEVKKQEPIVKQRQTQGQRQKLEKEKREKEQKEKRQKEQQEKEKREKQGKQEKEQQEKQMKEQQEKQEKEKRENLEKEKQLKQQKEKQEKQQKNKLEKQQKEKQEKQQKEQQKQQQQTLEQPPQKLKTKKQEKQRQNKPQQPQPRQLQPVKHQPALQEPQPAVKQQQPLQEPQQPEPLQQPLQKQLPLQQEQQLSVPIASVSHHQGSILVEPLTGPNQESRKREPKKSTSSNATLKNHDSLARMLSSTPTPSKHKAKKRCPPPPAPTPVSMSADDDIKTPNTSMFSLLSPNTNNDDDDNYNEKNEEKEDSIESAQKKMHRLKEWVERRSIELDADFFYSAEEDAGSPWEKHDKIKKEEKVGEEKKMDNWSITRSWSEKSRKNEKKGTNVTNDDAVVAVAVTPQAIVPFVPVEAASPKPRSRIPHFPNRQTAKARVPSLETSLKCLNVESSPAASGFNKQVIMRSSSECGRDSKKKEKVSKNDKKDKEDKEEAKKIRRSLELFASAKKEEVVNKSEKKDIKEEGKKDVKEKIKDAKNAKKEEKKKGERSASLRRSKTDDVLGRSDSPPAKKLEIRPFNFSETRKKTVPQLQSPVPFRARECPSYIRDRSVGPVGIPTVVPKPATVPKEFNLSQNNFSFLLANQKESEYTFRARAAPKFEFTPSLRESIESIITRAPVLRTAIRASRARSESPGRARCDVLLGSPIAACSRTPPPNYRKFRARPVPASVIRGPSVFARPEKKREPTAVAETKVVHSARRAEEHEKFRKCLNHRREESLRISLIRQSEEMQKTEDEERSNRSKQPSFKASPVPQSTYKRKNALIPMLYPITIPKSPRFATRVRSEKSIEKENKKE